jgi:hypothetical protein
MQSKFGRNFFYCYSNTVIVIILILAYLDIPVYLYGIGINILPKYFYYAFFVMVAPILLLKCKLLKQHLMSPFALWVLALVIFNFVYLIDANENVMNLVFTKNQILVLSVLLGFIFSVIPSESYERIFPILMTIVSALVIIDFFTPGIIYPLLTEGTVPGRAAGTLLNPTKAGEAILITCLFCISVVRVQYRMPLLFLAGMATFLTFSRGPLMIWISLFTLLLMTRRIPRRSTIIFLVLILLALPILMSVFESYLQEREDFSSAGKNLLARIDFFESHDLEDDSALERMEVLNAGIELFLQNPIFGAGVGATTLWAHDVGPHNQLVVFAAEYGIMGIVFWAWLAVILWRGNYFQDKFFQYFAVFLFVTFTAFNHNMLDFFYWLFTFELVSGKRYIRNYNALSKTY